MYTNRLPHIQYPISRAHMPNEQQSEKSRLSKRSVRSVIILPTRRAFSKLVHALLTGLVLSAPTPLPERAEQKEPAAASQQLTHDPPAPKTIHPAFRKRDSDEWSDDDPKIQCRLARFFPGNDPAMGGYTGVAIKLAEVDKRFSMESRQSCESRRSYQCNDETLDVPSVFRDKRRDSGFTIDSTHDVQIAKAIPLRRAVRKSFYPPPRPASK